MANQKKSFFFGVIVDLLGMPVTSLLGFVMVPVYLNYITVDEFGYWTTILEMANFAGLFWSSMEFYLIQQVSGNLSNREVQEKAIANASATISIWVTLTLGLLFLGALAFPNYLETIRFAHFSGLISLVTIWAVLKSYRHLLSCIVIGQNRMALANSFTLMTMIGFLILPWVYLKIGFGLLSFGYGYLSTFAAVSSLEFFLVGGLFLKSLKPRYLSKISLKESLVFSFQTFTSKLSLQLYGNINILLVAWGLGTVQVVVYSLTLKLTNFSKTIVPRIVSSGYPSFSRLLAEGHQTRMEEVIGKIFRFSLRFGLLLSFVIFFLNEVFVTHWVGADKFAGSSFTLIAALFCLKESTTSIFYQTVFATKEIKRANQIIVLESVLNVILVIVFMKLWGVTGVLLATLLATGILSPVYLVYKSKKLTGIRIGCLLSSCNRVVFKSLPSMGILYYGQSLLEANFTWVGLFGWPAVAGLVNLMLFEGLLILDIRHLGPKEMIKEIIERS
ncbi:MAG: hypothetical protein QNL04_00570 [SAR324 cluster bacterium]|nr:hypothetical protein [SAR324 cluster bacterium]